MTSISIDVNKEADADNEDGCDDANRTEVKNIKNEIDKFMTEGQKEKISPFREVLPQVSLFIILLNLKDKLSTFQNHHMLMWS